MKTHEFGARIIEKNDGAENIIAFGESQLLGLDYSDGEGPHDLHLIFPDNNQHHNHDNPAMLVHFGTVQRGMRSMMCLLAQYHIAQ